MLTRGSLVSSRRPSIATVPASGCSTPAMTFVRVDLPEPFSPTRAWTVPLRMVRSTSSSATTFPYVLRTPRTATAGGAPPSRSGAPVVPSEVILVDVLEVDLDPRLVAVDDLPVDRDGLVAGDTEVHPVGDLFTVEDGLGEHVHRVRGVSGVPEGDEVDGPGLEPGAGVVRGAGADDGDLVLQPGLLDRLSHADDVGGRRALDPLEVRVGREQLLHALVGDLGVVGGLDEVPDHLHVGVVLLLVLLRGGHPGHVGGRAQRADHHGVLALTAHPGGELLHEVDAVVLVAEGLQVPVGVLDLGGLVGDDDDVLRHRPAEDLFDGVGLEGYDGEGVDVGGEEVLDDADLGVGVGLARALHVGVDAGVRGVPVGALTEAGEPRDPGELGDGDDRVVAAAVGRGTAGGGVGATATAAVVLEGTAGGEGHGQDRGGGDESRQAPLGAGNGHCFSCVVSVVTDGGQNSLAISSRRRRKATEPGSRCPALRSPTQLARPRWETFAAPSSTAPEAVCTACAAVSPAGAARRLSTSSATGAMTSTTVLSPSRAPPRSMIRCWKAVSAVASSSVVNRSASFTAAAAATRPPPTSAA